MRTEIVVAAIVAALISLVMVLSAIQQQTAMSVALIEAQRAYRRQATLPAMPMPTIDGRAYVVEIGPTGTAALPAPRWTPPACVAVAVDPGQWIQLVRTTLGQITVVPPIAARAYCIEERKT